MGLAFVIYGTFCVSKNGSVLFGTYTAGTCSLQRIPESG